MASAVDRARRAAAALRQDYEAGKRGDDTEPEPLWASPKEQLAAMIKLLSSARRSQQVPTGDEAAPFGDQADGTADAEAADVATALRHVDWAGVRAATAERTSDAAAAMRSMADQVDWAKVQPVAAHVSSALIAAVASGQLRLGGKLGPVVARAIADQGGLGQRVVRQIDREQAPMPPDFRGAIEAAGREI
jgi:hypothetical protein